MEEVLKSVREAEAAAAERKAQAEAEAEKMLADSRARANEILKDSERELKSFRESALNEAEARIAKEAKRTLDENASKDKKAADDLLIDTSGEVSRIVRRVVDGDRRHA